MDHYLNRIVIIICNNQKRFPFRAASFPTYASVVFSSYRRTLWNFVRFVQKMCLAINVLFVLEILFCCTKNYRVHNYYSFCVWVAMLFFIYFRCRTVDGSLNSTLSMHTDYYLTIKIITFTFLVSCLYIYIYIYIYISFLPWAAITRQPNPHI